MEKYEQKCDRFHAPHNLKLVQIVWQAEALVTAMAGFVESSLSVNQTSDGPSASLEDDG